MIQCKHCAGTGDLTGYGERVTRCASCNGTGQVEEPKKEIDHHYTEEVICPHCGHQESDSQEYDDTQETKCDQCGQCFLVERDISITYSTHIIPMKDLPKMPPAY